MNEKEFGKLSAAQLKQSSSIIKKLLGEAGELSDPHQEQAGDFQDMVFPPWAELYEKSFDELGIIFLHYSGMLTILKTLEGEDRMQVFLDYIGSNPEFDTDGISSDPQHAAGFLCSFIPTILCIVSFCMYRKSVNRLLEEARQGVDKSFFQAVSIDPSVLSTKTAAARLAKAVMNSDKEFVDKLSRAIKGNYPKKPAEHLGFARLMLAFIEDATGHAHFTSGQLYSLFVEEMKVFPDDTVVDDSLDNFRVFLHRERKNTIPITRNRVFM